MADLSRSYVGFPGPSHPVNAYVSTPDYGKRSPCLILIQETWGLATTGY
jgi:dienelactone hydrolase